MTTLTEIVPDSTLNPAREAGIMPGTTLVAQSVLPVMGAVLLVPVMPLIFRQYGAMPNADFWIGALITAPGLCIALLSPLVGLLAKRFGRRTPLILALSIYGFAGTAPLVLSNFAAILASRVVLGIAEAIIITLTATLIGDYYRDARRAKWFAMISTVASTSAVFLFGVSGALGHAFGWRGPLIVYAAALVFVPMMILFTWEPKADPLPARTTIPPVTYSPALRAHLVRSGIVSFIGGTLFYTLVLQQGLGLAATGTTDPARIGMLTALASIGNILGTLLFRRFTAVSIPLLMTVEFALIGVAMIVIGQVTTDTHFAIAAFFGLIGAGALMPTVLTWTMRGLPFAARPLGTGIFQSSFMLGQFASGATMVFGTRALGGHVLTTFAMVGCMALIAAFIAAALHLTRIVPQRPVSG